jgi:hypothetical protein
MCQLWISKALSAYLSDELLEAKWAEKPASKKFKDIKKDGMNSSNFDLKWQALVCHPSMWRWFERGQ